MCLYLEFRTEYLLMHKWGGKEAIISVVDFIVTMFQNLN